MSVPVPLTGPTAIIRVKRGANGSEVVAGAIQNFTVTETINRETLFCLGNMYPWLAPAVSGSGTLTCEGVAVRYREDLLPYALARNVYDKEDYANRMEFDNQGMTITLYKKVPVLLNGADTINSMGNTDGVFGGVNIKAIEDGVMATPMMANLTPFATINKVFLVESGFGVGENKVGTQQSSFIFLEPIIYNQTDEYTVANTTKSINQESSRASLQQTATDFVVPK